MFETLLMVLIYSYRYRPTSVLRKKTTLKRTISLGLLSTMYANSHDETALKL